MAKKSNREAAQFKPDEEWRVESDLRTLIEARQIRNDPKRFAKAQALAQKRLTEVASVAGADGDGNE